MPLLHLDTEINLVQYIKLAEVSLVRMSSTHGNV